MRYVKPASALVAAMFCASSAMAEWQTTQSGNGARAVYKGGKYDLWISCSRGRGFELSLMDQTLGGGEFRGVKGLMMWITLPDGRTDRWPIDTFQEGPALSGRLVVSNFNLDFFRNGRSFTLDSPLTGKTFLTGDMKGTGAARLAFLERCGL